MNYKTVINNLLNTDHRTCLNAVDLRMKDKSWPRTGYHSTDLHTGVWTCPEIQSMLKSLLDENNIKMKNYETAYKYFSTKFWRSL